MDKRWIAFGLLFGFAGFAALVSGCGQAQQGATTSTTTQSVTISGKAAASASDLSQIGVSALAVRAMSADDLTSHGFTPASVKAAGLLPLAVSGTVATIGTLDASGNITAVATASVSSDGSYSVKIDNYDTALTYGCVVTKTNDSLKKTLEMKTIFPAPTGGEIKGSAASISPQTTLVAQMIIEKVVRVLETNKIDPKVIATVKDAIVAAVDVLITSGSISVSAIRDSSATENVALKENMEKAAADSTISGKLDAIENSALLGKATDFASAKGAIYELFKVMMGDPRGIPEEIVDSFARAYLSGTTKSVSEITTALNSSVFDRSTKAAVTGSFTTSQVATEIQNMLRFVYGAAGPTALTEQGTPPERVKSVLQTVFPQADWANKTIDASTSFSVPQLLLLVNVGERLAHSASLGFNPPKMAHALGLMAGIENKAKIMHAELRIMTFEDWVQPGTKPTPQRMLAAWVDIGNVVNPDPTETQGVTCTLTYLKSDGSTATVSLRERTDKAEFGPGPGWKMFSIEPWDAQGTDNKITDFKAGTATFKAIKEGNTIDTKQVELVDINLTSASLTINSPKPVWIDQAQTASRFSVGAQPTFNLKLNSLGITLPDGYRLGYVIQIRKGTLQNGQFNINWGDDSSRVYDSWEKQDFPSAIVGAVTNWVVPTALTSQAVYEFGITLVALNKKTNMPVAEGQHNGGVFIVGSPEGLSSLQQQYGYTPPPPAEELVITQTFTPEGKVHNDFYVNVTNPKVGLFKETPAAGGPTLTMVSGVSTTAFTAGTTSGGVAFKAYTLPNVPGSVLEKGKRYQALFFDDANGDNAINTGELFMNCKKTIEYRDDGVWAGGPEGWDKLFNSQSGFDFAPWGVNLN